MDNFTVPQMPTWWQLDAIELRAEAVDVVVNKLSAMSSQRSPRGVYLVASVCLGARVCVSVLSFARECLCVCRLQITMLMSG